MAFQALNVVSLKQRVLKVDTSQKIRWTFDLFPRVIVRVSKDEAMLTEVRLIEMVKEALRAHDRNEYERLSADGSLDLVARLKADAAMETRNWLMERARDEALASNVETLERVQRQMMKNRQANEIAIAQATEFGRDDAGHVY